MEKMRPREDGSRDGNCAASSHGCPEPTEAGRDKEELLLLPEPLERECGLADTLISDCWPPNL